MNLLAVFGYGINVNNLNFEKEFGLYIKNAAKDLAIKYLAIKSKESFDVIGSHFRTFVFPPLLNRIDTLFILFTERPDYIHIMVYPYWDPTE